MYKCCHFGIRELVSKIVYDKYKEFCWSFFDKEILEDIDYIREAFGSAITINNWAVGGSNSQCGLRSNLDPIVKEKKILYLSAHCMGKAFDLHASNGKNEQLHNLVYNLVKNKKLKAIKRLENYKNTPGWVHVDSFQTSNIVF